MISPLKSTSNVHWILLGVGMLLILTSVWGHPAPDPNRGLSDALKYLRELDKIYAHVAMPRIKSVLVVGSLRSDRTFVAFNELSPDMEDTIMSMKQLHELDKLYSNRIRPRFGKRTEVRNSPAEYDEPSEDDIKDWLSQLNGR